MNLKFTFIFFCLILSVISLNLKKKNENKKSLNGIRAFLKTNIGEVDLCKKLKPRNIYRPECSLNNECWSNVCINGKCVRVKEGEPCMCDFHCQTGHCSFHYWLFKSYYRCTKY